MLVYIASGVTPRVNEHHMNSRIQDFTIILWIYWTSRFKIYKDLYSFPPDLWPVAGPLVIINNHNFGKIDAILAFFFNNRSL